MAPTPIINGILVNSVTGRPFVNFDPRARLDVELDWSLWVAQEGTAVVSNLWSVNDPALTLQPQTPVANVVRVIISGGVAGTTYQLRAVTQFQNGFTDSRGIDIRCQDR